MRPIQGPSRQTIGFPAEDGSSKNPSYVQAPAQPAESPDRSQASKSNSIGEARLQGDLRAAELNTALRSNNPSSDQGSS